MKPRIRLVCGLWVCHSIGTSRGYGYTPEQAWREWWNLLRREWAVGLTT